MCFPVRCDFNGRICIFGLRSVIAGVYLLKVILCAALSKVCERADDHLRVGLGNPEVLRSIQSKQLLQCTKALFTTETVFLNQFFNAVF